MARPDARLRPATGLVVLLTLGGCAFVPPAAPPAPSAQAVPAESRSWSGRIGWSIAATPEQPAQQASAGFELRGSAREGSLELTSPVGTLLARARWRAGVAELESPQGRSRHDDLASLSRAAFGDQEMPLAALFDWLLGQPWPGAPHEMQPAGFSQMGWLVDVQALAQGRLTATRPAAPAAPAAPAITLRVRLEAMP
ncbi:MAG: lipoprotein insertase outer membrane protein LolB [Rubrivivax sp.]